MNHAIPQCENCAVDMYKSDETVTVLDGDPSPVWRCRKCGNAYTEAEWEHEMCAKRCMRLEALLRHLLGALHTHDRTYLAKCAELLKTQDGERWAIGEFVERALQMTRPLPDPKDTFPEPQEALYRALRWFKEDS